MSIPPHELALIVERASYRAAPQEVDAARHAAAAIRLAHCHADEASDGSRFLRDSIRLAGDYLPDASKEAFSSVQLFGIDSPYVNAIPEVCRGQRRIFVFEGLQQLVFYYASLVKVLEALQALRPSVQFIREGESEPEAMAFSLAGFSILSDSLARQRFPALIHDMLGPTARAEIMSAYRLAVIFVLLHELGHIELGHLALTDIRSERCPALLAQPEQLNSYQLDELAADAFAFGMLPPRLRGEFIPSVMFLLGGYAFLEAFSGSLSAYHPLAINRLAALADLATMSPSDQAIVRAWIADQVESWRRFGGRRAALGANLRAKIEERMPVMTAYRIIADIKARVLAENGPLQIEHGHRSDDLAAAPMS